MNGFKKRFKKGDRVYYKRSMGGNRYGTVEKCETADGINKIWAKWEGLQGQGFMPEEDVFIDVMEINVDSFDLKKI